MTICGIYHPPFSATRDNTPLAFNDGITNMLTDWMPTSKNWLLLGDFNINLSDVSNNEVCIFRDTMEALGLKQHVTLSTHISGHTLDLVYCEESSQFTVLSAHPDKFISDHKSVIVQTTIVKEKLHRRKITVRKTKQINVQSLNDEFCAQNIESEGGLEDMASTLETELSRILDQLAPEKEITVTERKLNPWYNDFIREQKRVVRSCERRWLTYREKHQWMAFKHERNRYNFLVRYEKTQTISNKIVEIGKDTKKLYAIMESLTGVSTSNPLPEGTPEELAEEFAEFFLNKILDIRKVMKDEDLYKHQKPATIRFSKFLPLSEREVESIVMSMQTKSCEIDAIPTALLKQLLPSILPVLTKLVNTSLENGLFCSTWKEAVVRPLLKKYGLDLLKKNYRPVSNLKFLSKLLERGMLFHFTKHCDDFGLLPAFQSAYRPAHSCETALLSLCDDALSAMENQEILAVTIMDLSAAFDTVDHHVLLNILEQRFGIHGTALQWFENFLRPRSFKVCVENSYSLPKDLQFSVPQGSSSGAFIFLCYASPIETVIPENLVLNGFADDHSVRCKFKAGNLNEELSVIKLIELCMQNVKRWMTTMRLKLNDNKTEFICFGSHKQLAKMSTPSINVNGVDVNRSKVVKYLGSFLDETLSFKKHVVNKARTAMFNFVRIRNIRRFLTKEACETLTLGLVMSHLDYNNSLLYGLPEIDIKKLQRIQNMCAKLVLGKAKFESSKECLCELHWLPIRARIEHKILSLTFNCLAGTGPEYLIKLLVIEQPTRSLRSNSNNILRLSEPRTKLKTFKARSFSVAAPKLWNSLPNDIRLITNLGTFKKNVKTWLFRKYLY